MRIGEAAAAAGMTTKTLRFYEDRGLLPPPARAVNGYREYPHDAVDLLAFIRRCRAAGFTLSQIRVILQIRHAGHLPCRHVQQMLLGQLKQLDDRIRDLHALRTAVAELHEPAFPQGCAAEHGVGRNH